jgi:hypothetical protein
MTSICLSAHSARTFRILSTLPFFRALCDKKLLSGIVLFNPELESDELLRRWLVYRDPTLAPWARAAPRVSLIHEAIREMLLHGESPALGTFVEFDTSGVSVSFLASWLAWYGVIPGPNGDIAARTDSWWRVAAEERLQEMKVSPLRLQFMTDSQARSIRGSSQRLAKANARARVIRDRLLQGFETLDNQVVGRFSTQDFNMLLKILAHDRYPRDSADIISAHTLEQQQKRLEEYKIFRATHAIASATGTAMVNIGRYVEEKKNVLRLAHMQVATDPQSFEVNNASFWVKHGLAMALRSIAGLEGMPTVLLTSVAIEIITMTLRSVFPTWVVAESLVGITVRLLMSLQKSGSSGTHVATLIAALLRQRKQLTGSTEKFVSDNLLFGFLSSFVNSR